MNKKQILSVAAGMVMLTACSEYDPGLTGGWTGDYTPAELQLMEKYTENFEARYGKIDENHTWGFGSAEAGAKTRGAFPNGNQWENDYHYEVPKALDSDVKEIVRQYFQQHPNLTYTDPGWTDFCIQQVYKGHTKIDDKSQTEEEYLAANNNTAVGGNEINQLFDGNKEHINNFNAGNNTDWDGCMFLASSSTASFGYHNSFSGVTNHDRAALVHWKVIYKWAKGLNLNGYEKLNDGWNRSYMGFDWDGTLDNIYVDKTWGTFHRKYNADGTNVESYWNEFADGYDYPTFDFNNQSYRILDKKYQNKYTYDKNVKYGGKVDLDDNKYKDVDGNTGWKNTTLVKELLSLGYLPVEDTREFMKPAPLADGYYSDWIVTLTKGGKQEDPDPNPDSSDDSQKPTVYRIMCEDLGNTNDFDFNDLVFDVYFTGEPENYTAHVRVQAAGGTLPIYLAYDGNETWEAHHILGVWDETIVPINVGTGNTATPKDIEIYNLATNNPNDINIYVEKMVAENTKETILLPKSGTNGLLTKAPQKICIPNGQNVRWMKEMQQIESAYPHFADWVQNEWGQYGFSGATPWTTTDVNSGPLY